MSGRTNGGRLVPAVGSGPARAIRQTRLIEASLRLLHQSPSPSPPTTPTIGGGDDGVWIVIRGAAATTAAAATGGLASIIIPIPSYDSSIASSAEAAAAGMGRSGGKGTAVGGWGWVGAAPSERHRSFWRCRRYKQETCYLRGYGLGLGGWGVGGVLVEWWFGLWGGYLLGVGIDAKGGLGGPGWCVYHHIHIHVHVYIQIYIYT